MRRFLIGLVVLGLFAAGGSSFLTTPVVSIQADGGNGGNYGSGGG